MANFSLYAIPAMFTGFALTHAYGFYLVRNEYGRPLDNTNPRRAWLEASAKVPSEIWDRAQRANNASLNQLESMPLFFAAIFAGNLARLSHRKLNTYAGLYLVLRVLYTFEYIFTTSQKRSLVRTVVWLGSVTSAMGLIIQAANALQ